MSLIFVLYNDFEINYVFPYSAQGDSSLQWDYVVSSVGGGNQNVLISPSLPSPSSMLVSPTAMNRLTNFSPAGSFAQTPGGSFPETPGGTFKFPMGTFAETPTGGTFPEDMMSMEIPQYNQTGSFAGDTANADVNNPHELL